MENVFQYVQQGTAAAALGLQSSVSLDPPKMFSRFNHDASLVAVGSAAGLQVLQTSPLGVAFAQRDEGGVGVCDVLRSSALVAASGSGESASASGFAAKKFSARALRLLNAATGATLCEFVFSTPILNVLTNDVRLVVVLDRSLVIYELPSLRPLHILVTAENPRGICALSQNGDNCLLVYPDAFSPGAVAVYDALRTESLRVIDAHRNPLAFLAINPQGTLLATASLQGTNVKVFDLPLGDQGRVFRRGNSPAAITAAAFSANGALLAVASGNGTIHVFNVGQLAPFASLPSDQDAQQGTPSSSAALDVRSFAQNVTKNLMTVFEERGSFTAPIAEGIALALAFNPAATCLFAVTAQGAAGKIRMFRITDNASLNETQVWVL